MSVPAAVPPPGHGVLSPRPHLAAVRPPEATPAEPARNDAVRRAVVPVLAGLAFPAHRWQVLAECDAWGATGPVRHLLTSLPEGCYRDLDSVLDVLRMLHRRAGPS